MWKRYVGQDKDRDKDELAVEKSANARQLSYFAKHKTLKALEPTPDGEFEAGEKAFCIVAAGLQDVLAKAQDYSEILQAQPPRPPRSHSRMRSLSHPEPHSRARSSSPLPGASGRR